MLTGTLIHDVLRTHDDRGGIAGPEHFDLGPARPCDPEILLADSTSLYAFADGRFDQPGRAVFVQVEPGVDPSSAPFLYRAQKQHACRLITIPYAEFVALGATLPVPERPALLFSVGRCGSTLLCRAVHALGSADLDVRTLSEPDVFTHAVGMRAPDGSRDQELVALLDTATRFLAHAFPADRLLIKFRGFSTQVADLLAAALPAAPSLFLTRELDGWMQSTNRLVRLRDPDQETHFLDRVSSPGPSLMYGYDRTRYLPELRTTTPQSWLEEITLSWVSLMRTFLDLSARQLVGGALAYDAMCADPTFALKAVAESYGLPSTALDEAVSAFGVDSQSGTPLSGWDARSNGVPDLGPADLSAGAALSRRAGLDPAIVQRLPGDLLLHRPARRGPVRADSA